MLDQAFGLLINEIALDIGTYYIRVYSKGRETYIEEPAVVIAENRKGKRYFHLSETKRWLLEACSRHVES